MREPTTGASPWPTLVLSTRNRAMSEELMTFRIDVPPSEIDDLSDRLRRSRWPERETVDDWSQGVPLAYLQEVCRYWAEEYDWRDREARLNRFPQFRTVLDGLAVHFVHVRSRHAQAWPLLMTHGWPGSVVEFQKVIAPLTDPEDPADAFDVVCPSLPGYGFSDKPTQPGWGVERVGTAWAQLMARLGYDRYFAQGGDWGAGVTTALGIDDPSHCAAIHLNLVTALPDKSSQENLTQQERAALDALAEHQRWGPATQPSSPPAPKLSATVWLTPRPPKRPGSSRSSGPGATATVIPRTSSAGTKCSTTSCSTGCPMPAPPQRACTGRASTVAGGSRSGPDGRLHLSQGDLPAFPPVGRADLHRHPVLERIRQGRTLRGLRAARIFRGRSPSRVPVLALARQKCLSANNLVRGDFADPLTLFGHGP